MDDGSKLPDRGILEYLALAPSVEEVPIEEKIRLMKCLEDLAKLAETDLLEATTVPFYYALHHREMSGFFQYLAKAIPANIVVKEQRIQTYSCKENNPLITTFVATISMKLPLFSVTDSLIIAHDPNAHEYSAGAWFRPSHGRTLEEQNKANVELWKSTKKAAAQYFTDEQFRRRL